MIDRRVFYLDNTVFTLRASSRHSPSISHPHVYGMNKLRPGPIYSSPWPFKAPLDFSIFWTVEMDPESDRLTSHAARRWRRQRMRMERRRRHLWSRFPKTCFGWGHPHCFCPRYRLPDSRPPPRSAFPNPMFCLKTRDFSFKPFATFFNPIQAVFVPFFLPSFST